MKSKVTVLISAAATVAIALVSTACGSSAYSSAGYGSPIAASAPTRAAAATVSIGSTQLGRILVDSNGRTLYLFEKDGNRRSACYGQCATFWPPLLTHGKPVARGSARKSLLGTTRRANASQQVTYAGHPLYRYVQDRKPGQTTGEGSLLFGAGWDALSPAGKKIESDDG